MAPDAGTMNHMLAVRRFAAGDAPAAATIIQGLPDYFPTNVPPKAEREPPAPQPWVIPDSGGCQVVQDVAEQPGSVPQAALCSVDGDPQDFRGAG